MKVVLAIDSFKGCLSSVDAERAAACGVRLVMPHAQVVCLPMSDGGEGMTAAFVAAMRGTTVTVPTHDPLMRPIMATYGLSPDGATAIVESAAASGLMLLASHERNPLVATSYGTGELMAHAARSGCRRIIVGLGGTATSDAGRGMLEALGVKCNGTTIDDSQCVLRGIEVVAASDVSNPLCGPLGAARMFAPQKGATPAMVEQLETRTMQFAQLTAAHLHRDVSTRPGAGAAGGIGFALMAYADATITSGADVLLDLLNFDKIIDDANLVITGEGSADAQTLLGKLPHGVMRRAKRHGVPTALIAGKVSRREQLLEAGFHSVTCINDFADISENCMEPKVAMRNITTTTARLVAEYRQNG